MKYVRYSCPKCHQALDEINSFPRRLLFLMTRIILRGQPLKFLASQEAICYSSSVRGTDISHWQLKHIQRCPLPPSSPVVCSAEMGQSSQGLIEIHRGNSGGATSRGFWQMCHGIVKRSSPLETGGAPYNINLHRRWNREDNSIWNQLVKTFSCLHLAYRSWRSQIL